VTGSWEPDPTGRHELRWRDGETWTDQVADGGATAVDPMPPTAPVPPPPVAPVARRSRRPLVIAAVLAVVALGAGAVVLTAGGDDEPAGDAFERPADDGADAGDEADDSADADADETPGAPADDLSPLEAAALAELALDEAVLPEGSALPTFAESYQLDCAVAAAGLDESTIVDLAFIDAGVDPDGEPTLLAAAITTFDDAAAIPTTLAELTTAFTEATAEAGCAFDGFEPEPAEPLEVAGSQTTSFLDEEETGDFAEHFLAVGRFLIEVQVAGGDGAARDELAADLLEQVATTLAEGDVGEVDEAGRAAAVAIDAIVLGDDLPVCAFGPVASLTAALPAGIAGSAFDAITEDDVAGQVFSGGEVPITYCELFPDGGDLDGIRLDVAPGPLDLAAYLDEEFGLALDDLDVSAAIEGGEALAGCVGGSCHAVLVGDVISFAVRLEGLSATTDQALAVLEALHPVAFANLGVDAAGIT
jgi:hypothetical protein